MLVFHNPGEIDIRGATVAGLNAKESDNAIGYFGTGLKYAIAQVLANGGSVAIYAGLTKHEFFTSELDFRGKQFAQICMRTYPAGVCGDSTDGPITEFLGFTTEYGKAWKPWQIFRELYANALDEHGGVAQVNSTDAMIAQPCPDTTVIVVSGWSALEERYRERDTIILPPDLAYTYAGDELCFDNTPASHLYFKGVRVADCRTKFLWNFQSGVSLTEDRTLDKGAYDIGNTACHFISDECTDEAIIEKFLRAKKDAKVWESMAQAWHTWPSKKAYCSEPFANVATRLYRECSIEWSCFEELAHDHEPGLKAARLVQLTRLQEGMLERAKMLVARMGFEDEIACLPIQVEFLGGKVLGRWKDGIISLAPMVFDQGTKQVVSTLYEECTHAKYGYRDNCYEMQTHLFNQIISLWEELLGEPC